MIVVSGSFRLPADKLESARGAMTEVIRASREEPGCLAYSYAEDVLDPGLIRVSEAWVSGEVLSRHFETPHMQQWKQEREELGMTERNITMHAVKNSVDL